MKTIAIFASGTGSNATKIMAYFKDHDNIRVGLIVSNKSTAGVLEAAKKYEVPSLVINRGYFYETEDLLTDLAAHAVDFIVLAGFLWLIPSYLVHHFEQGIVNIHPALLPKYGGKGMYGKHVHQAVWTAKERESGMTIHYVNEHYDEGNIVFQAKCAITPEDKPTDIAKNVLKLEHQHYAKVIEQLLSDSVD